MKDSDLKGITINGVSLKETIESGGLQEPLSSDIKEEFNKNHHIYKRNTAYNYKDKGKNGPVEHRIFEINKECMSKNVEDSIKTHNRIKAIISVILGLENPITLVDIFEVIKRNAINSNIEHLLNISAHSLRNYMGMILRSEFAQYIEISRKGGDSKKYRIDPEYRDKFNIIEAMQLAERKMKKQIVKDAKEQTEKDKDKLKKIASFTTHAKNGTEINVNVFGKIQIEFSFK